MIEYDPHRWRTTLFAVRGSMVKTITKRISLVFLSSVAITLFHDYVMPIAASEVAVAHGFVGASLGLLLVFRTNASYDRWWEGRKLWGSIVNTSRNLARSASVHLKADPDRMVRVLKLAAAWPWSSMNQLRKEPHKLDGLDERDLDLSKAQHVPTAICQRISSLLDEARQQGKITDIVFSVVDQNNQILVDCIGACERIDKTPLPFAYVVHLRRALIIYCASLPFALIPKFDDWAVLMTFLISYILFGIEEIGVEIENPFEGDENDLPLEKICQTIAGNVNAFIPKAP
jgi:ion channel-forming bestrophin family protein